VLAMLGQALARGCPPREDPTGAWPDDQLVEQHDADAQRFIARAGDRFDKRPAPRAEPEGMPSVLKAGEV
jgi:hypothetical protein